MKNIFRTLIVVAFLATFSAQAQNNFTFVFLHKNPEAPKLSKPESDSIMGGHMANIERLAKEKKLISAGPFDGGGGIFIFRESKTEEIHEWLKADPGVQAKRWNLEILPYKPRYNSVCVAPEPYEMVSYSFVRFDAIVSKSTASTYPQIIKKHDDYLKKLTETGNVVTEGIFGDNAGGIIILKGDVDRAVFETDPGVQEGLLELVIKKLYIAKGAFCEN